MDAIVSNRLTRKLDDRTDESPLEKLSQFTELSLPTVSGCDKLRLPLT